MTTAQGERFIPELTLGWRLRMAREATGLGLREFAAEIGVAPDTCTSAEKDRRKVRPITINAYALRTGVDRRWLETGESPTDDGPVGAKGGTLGSGNTDRYSNVRRLVISAYPEGPNGQLRDVS